MLALPQASTSTLLLCGTHRRHGDQHKKKCPCNIPERLPLFALGQINTGVVVGAVPRVATGGRSHTNSSRSTGLINTSSFRGNSSQFRVQLGRVELTALNRGPLN